MISSLYLCPSQNSEEVESFLTNYNYLLSDISWWSNDIDSAEGTKLFSLSTSNGFHQIISEPTHIHRNSSSCIDLTFTE